jgi:signal transduction histidine kinase
MARIVNDLLVLARSDAGEQALWVEELYLNDVVDECCENARSLARQKSVQLQYEPAPDDIPFRGDQELLRRRTANLVDNAIYYTPAGGRVRVALASSAQEVRFTVQDTGVGIRSEDIERVFERFYRTSASRSRSSGGSGLGLSIVKVAAESHLGKVSLTSELHCGSCFVVTLPPSGLAPSAESES